MNGTATAATQIGSLIIVFGLLITHIKYTNNKIEKHKESMYQNLTHKDVCDERVKRIEQKIDTVIGLLKKE